MQNHEERGPPGDAVQDETGPVLITASVLITQSDTAMQDDSAAPDVAAQNGHILFASV
jgi:hypothetical protein